MSGVPAIFRLKHWRKHFHVLPCILTVFRHKKRELLFSNSLAFKWCHREMSFISKWLYIFALKNRNKRNLPLLLHLISALFCSVSQSRVPTLMQSYCFILKYKQMLQNFAPPQFGIPTSRCKTMQNIISLVYLLI